ncbi:MAG: MATE family efflux transporter, partial [Ruminococcus sp.]
MKDRMGNGQLYKNIFMNVAAFLVQFVISFYVSPVIVKGVGPSAYGFIGLANDFVSYATIISSVFNSVAARFIAKAFYEEDYEKANRYFNSLIVTNFVLAGIFSVISIVIVPNLDSFISIPADIMFDVKLTFSLTFLSYIITLVTTVFTTSTFVSNRTDIQGIRNIIQYIIRFSLI